MFPARHYTAAFDREQGFTAAEWCALLPRAVAPHAFQLSPADGTATVALPGGQLRVRWQALPPRAIALMRMPRLAVQYRFDGVADDERVRFMQRFDLVTQRGGG